LALPNVLHADAKVELMASLANRSFLAMPAVSDLRRGEDAGVHLRLVPIGDEWSLVTPTGDLVFHASDRLDCLEYARAKGVLAVLS
jgi:hypothetical protein